MDTTELYYNKLREAIEMKMGRKLSAHGDFKELSTRLYKIRKDLISETTLKRFWGYLKNESHKPQTRTLNSLAELVGYKDFEDFCKYQDNLNDLSSDFVMRDTLHCFLLRPEARVRVSWYPNRTIVLQHEGQGDLFRVVDAANSKLRTGMTAHCEMFVQKRPLLLKNIEGPGITSACDYLCGKVDGVVVEIMD